MEGKCKGCESAGRLGRRRFLGLLGGGAVLALAGCGTSAPQAAGGRRPGTSVSTGGVTTSTSTTTTSTTTTSTTAAKVAVGQIPAPHPGTAKVIFSGPAGTRRIALTIDDGYCSECVAGYVHFAKASGIHVTLNPNGMYSPSWSPDTTTLLRELIAAGQVQIGNHTWSHAKLTALSTRSIVDEITRNEDWIANAFGVTGRPYLRPPYGFQNARLREVAGNLGYTSILMWNGTLGDATVETPEVLVGLAETWLKPGNIVLGHLNHPAVLSLFDRIQSIIAARALEPVTLDEMFGTSRSTG